MSHDLNWNEVRMHILCLERKPVPIFTASYTQKYTWCTRYHADVEYECEIIPLSTDDPLHFMFEYEESIITDSDVTTAHTYFLSKDNKTMIATNSTLSYYTSGDNKKVAAKNSSKNSCTNNSEESSHDDETIIAQLELTNNHTLAYLDDGTRVHARSKARHHDDCYSNCCRDNVTVATVTLSDSTASNSTSTPEEKEIVSSKNNCSEIGDKTESCCVPYTFSVSNQSYPKVMQPVFANSSTFSNSTIRARSSSSDSWLGSSACGAGAFAAVPLLSSDVALPIIIVIVLVIIETLLLIVIVDFVNKYFLQPKPKE